MGFKVTFSLLILVFLLLPSHEANYQNMLGIYLIIPLQKTTDRAQLTQIQSHLVKK